MKRRRSALFVLALGLLFAPTPSAQAQPAGRPPLSLSPWLDPDTAPAGMQYHTFPSKRVGGDVSYALYLPPGYDENPTQRYPVVYWLHGRGGYQSGASLFARLADEAFAAGKAPAMIVVGVNGRRIGSWVDTFDGQSPVQSVMIEELIPHIDATYRTIADRAGRAIEGFSMGGAGAPKIGFKYPELFGTVGIISGALHDFESYSTRGTALQDIYGGDRDYFEANSPWQVVRANADAIRGRTHVRVAVGDQDQLQEANTAYHQLLDELHIVHGFTVVPGATHNPRQVYTGLGDDTWVFYNESFASASPAKP